MAYMEGTEFEGTSVELTRIYVDQRLLLAIGGFLRMSAVRMVSESEALVYDQSAIVPILTRPAR